MVKIMIDTIRKIVSAPISEDAMRELIFRAIASDEKAIPAILKILESERKSKRELVEELNVLLSTADLVLKEPKAYNGNFRDKIKEFYDKGLIGHCFNMEK